MTTLEKAPVETEETTDRPPMLHAYFCSYTRKKIKAMCGFKEIETEGFEQYEEPGEKCVVCLEMQWIPCPVCGG